jgi:hypothetical protein
MSNDRRSFLRGALGGAAAGAATAEHIAMFLRLAKRVLPEDAFVASAFCRRMRSPIAAAHFGRKE